MSDTAAATLVAPHRSGMLRIVRAVWSSSRSRAAARALVGVALLLVIALRVGAEPFLRGLASISVPAIVAALALTALATVAASWRWRVVAARLELRLGWGEAISAYYRSQLLNTVLPGGVIGDVERAVTHGRDAGRLAQASRAVVVERSAGQAVQLTIVAGGLAWLGLSAYAPAVGVLLVVVGVACAGVIVAATVNTRARAAVRRELSMLRIALGDLRTALTVVAASTIVVACHVATFVVACIAVGVDAPPQRTVGIALIVLLAASIPFNVGGWGPRDGAAAWAFAALGLGAATGVAASTTFGVLAMIAVAPGAAVIATAALRGRRSAHRARSGGLATP